ncbi:MAG: hypothetical protein A2289_14040 [Deltaproteobacteria bacterium RIFOXYA12_FULL_58_15]|nr:MAG: hypothetical protein A2289_14040 [Deltaproteobacteria bacterium RIFOXYA12_FULL_58_15]OGR09627.1 MAG: hypothetical protein A2341_00230 [Deltaproteobacteria bacterium RIFOXYB12_FULL_58_9]
MIIRRTNIVAIALGTISCLETPSGHDPDTNQGDPNCNQLVDCFGVCGGSAEFDDCGNCGGYIECPIGAFCNLDGTACNCPEGLFASDGECVDNALRCYSQEREEYVDCSEAVENDFCDTDASFPMRSFLREGVWDGTTCVP